MRADTVRRKKTTEVFKELHGEKDIRTQMFEVMLRGKDALDSFIQDLGRMLAETIMYIERENIAGPDYRPFNSRVQKWASQQGSIYVGDQKMFVEHPRVRGPKGEMPLKSYQRLRRRGEFSEAVLAKALRGLSANKYKETVVEAARAFGVSASSVSRHLVEITAKKLLEFKERDLSQFKPFAIFVDTIHRGGEAFMVALGMDVLGNKCILGFWQGATENHVICEELLAKVERRGLVLSKRIIWVTDGGVGIIKALRDRFGKKLIHSRCMIHKSRNIQKHLAKRYRKEAHQRLILALKQNRYDDARVELQSLEKWLRGINESAAESLNEAFDELLTLHRLEIPLLLRKSLWTTNPIESMFSTVRDCEGNIKRYRGSRMAQRWLASVLLHCEEGFRKIKGHQHIPDVIKNIDMEQNEMKEVA